MTLTTIYNNLAYLNLLPEAFLGFMILVQLVFYSYKTSTDNPEPLSNTHKNEVMFIQLILILTGTLILLFVCDLDSTSMNFLIHNDETTSRIKKITIFFSILASAPIAYCCNLQKINDTEFYSFYLISVLSSMLLVSAGDFLSAYLALEMQALCFYILAAYKRTSFFSVSGAVRYFVFGSLVSCMLLYALSILYGSLGTLNFHDLSMLCTRLVSTPPVWPPHVTYAVFFSVVVICITLFFKIGIVPFHFWLPDVYEGAPMASTIIFSYLPKLVLFNLFIKMNCIFEDFFSSMSMIFIIIGVLTVIVGGVFSVQQERLKKFIIYSSISQMGFPIIMFGEISSIGIESIYFFVIVYTVTSILLWNSYILLYHFVGKELTPEQEQHMGDPLHKNHYKGLFYIDAPWALFFAISFFSLAGIPPLVGFSSKALVIIGLAADNYYISAAFLSIFAAVSVYAYIRIIKMMFFMAPMRDNTFNATSRKFSFLPVVTILVSVICLAFLLHAFFFLDIWLQFAASLSTSSPFI